MIGKGVASRINYARMLSNATICPNCGEKLKGSGKYCSSCGHAFSENSSSRKHAQEISRFANQSVKDQLLMKNLPSKNKSLMIFCVAFSLIALIVLLAILFMR